MTARLDRCTRVFAFVAGISAFVVGPGACKTAPPGYPTAVVEVDTDLPLPQVISHLQVDVFDERGQWADHRRFAFTTAEGWPASFGIYLKDDSRETSVLVRLRGYANGGERDYRGERAATTEPYAPLAYAKSIDELCENATDLPAREVRVLLAGPTPLFSTTCDSLTNYAGSVAARVHIPAAGRYRFEILPALTISAQDTFSLAPSLHLVRDCTRPMTNVACDTQLDPTTGTVARIEQDLEPGDYTMVTGSWAPGSVGNIALRWAPASDWGTPTIPPPPATAPESAIPLRFEHDGVDDTPAVEPAPEATVDRLVRVHLRPDTSGVARVVLRGACAGQSSKLAFRADGTVDAESSSTCVDGVLAPAPLATLGEARSKAPPSEAGTFAVEPCEGSNSGGDRVCVPGGAFVLGSSLPGIAGSTDEYPRRIAAVKRFWMDRYEFSVARYRDAVERGLRLDQISPLHPPLVNDGPLEEGSYRTESTFSTEPIGREQLPLTGIRPDAAREICRFVGGDLPTEAQWERAASYDDRGERTFPWGDETPTCERSAVSRSKENAHECKGNFPAAVDGTELAGDTSALGIVGLFGNVSEHVVGSALGYGSACFRGAGVIDPICDEPSLPQVIHRGSSWKLPVVGVGVTRRRVGQRHSTATDVGFRCVYSTEEASR